MPYKAANWMAFCPTLELPPQIRRDSRPVSFLDKLSLSGENIASHDVVAARGTVAADTEEIDLGTT